MAMYLGSQKVCPVVKVGTTPTGTLSITANGVYDVTNYASADVNVSGGGGGSTKYGISLDSILGDVNASGVLQTPSVDANLVFTGVTDIAQEGLYYKFCYNGKIKSCSFPSLTTVSGVRAMNYAFLSCTGLTSADLSSLTTISGQRAMYYAFRSCTGLTSIDLSSLTTVSGNDAMDSAFYGCTSLTSINFNNLQTIGVDSSSTNGGHFNNCFYGCNNLTSITFPKLEKIYCTSTVSTHGTFYGNNKIQKLYFPKLDTITYGTGAITSNQNACKYIFSNCSALTELHFAAANQAAIEASLGYSTAWGRGAGNVTIYFDL